MKEEIILKLLHDSTLSDEQIRLVSLVKDITGSCRTVNECISYSKTCDISDVFAVFSADVLKLAFIGEHRNIRERFEKAAQNVKRKRVIF